MFVSWRSHISCKSISKDIGCCQVLTYRQDELNLTKSGPGRKKVYPECIMHGEKVFKWWDGKPTADVPGYDNREPKAKARAGGSRKAKAKLKSDSNLGNEEDGECESDPEYEPMNQPGGN